MVLYRKWLRNPASFVMQNILPSPVAEIVKDMTKKEVEDKFGYAADIPVPEDPKFENENEFSEKLRDIAVKMRNDGLCLFVDVTENPVKVSIKATFHLTIFEIPMRPMREDQRHRRRFTH